MDEDFHEVEKLYTALIEVILVHGAKRFQLTHNQAAVSKEIWDALSMTAAAFTIMSVLPNGQEFYVKHFAQRVMDLLPWAREVEKLFQQHSQLEAIFNKETKDDPHVS